MFPGSPEEWEREWRFKERLKQVEALLVRHREAMDHILQENRELKKENQRLLRGLALFRRERDKVREILLQMEKRLADSLSKRRGRVGKKEA
jgi:hypothetical protein